MFRDELDAIEFEFFKFPNRFQNLPIWHKKMTFLSQLRILLIRNLILIQRYWRSSLAQCIGAPLLFMLLLYILQQADYANQSKSNPHPPSATLGGLNNCQGRNAQDPCINMLFTPLNSNTSAFMKAFAVKNAVRTGQPEWKLENPLLELDVLPSKMLGMVPVASPDFIYNYALHHPNITQWGISFAQSWNPIPTVQYQIWYNASLVANGTDVFGRSLVSLLRGMDEAIISVLNDPDLKILANLDITLKDWPLVPAKTLSDTIVQNLGPVFFFCCVMVIFINVLNQIVTEKEAKLRHAMQMMGLRVCLLFETHFDSLLYIGGVIFSRIRS